ncbi:beta strand repeat-containing protein [Rhizobium sp. BR 314]|uniref:beta strand repeat-containing protein n=1 Tax=Rhizobium sp. BR 314 TaxID=3040013 RepID=UPI0039BF52D5
MGSGEQATLDLSGDGFLQVAVPTKAKGDGALVDNSGRISARGGTVQLSAAAARDMARQAVNMSGTIEARGVSGRSGDIVLSGGDGEVAISGNVDASSRRGSGGKVEVTGRKITLANAKINASGKTGGGTVNIGGNRQGKGPLQHAETLTIDANTVINADAVTTGHGGNVVLWSDDLTRFAGTITAKGGTISGNGGEAEVSGKAKLSYTGLTDLTAAHGSVGNLLLDPYNMTISTGTDSNSSGFTATGNDSIINVNTLTNALATANVTVSTGGAGSAGSQAGTITVAAPITWSALTTLTLSAASDITINAAVTASGASAGLVLQADNSGTGAGTVSFGAGGSVALSGSSTAARIYYNPSSFGTATDFSSKVAANSVIAYQLVNNLTDLQAISLHLNGNFALGKNLDASATVRWNGGSGFVPIGVDRAGNVLNNSNGFNGNFDGQNHAIYNLTAATVNYAGLFGYAGTGSRITRVGLVGGSVYGGSNVGGLVGYSAGSVTSSFATIAVNGGSDNVGGLVGYNLGSVSTSYATGAVVGNFYVGGLVGWSVGSVTQAYATGAVTGYKYVGDLVGVNGGTIAYTFTSGLRPGYGLVGLNLRTVSNSFWDTDTNDQYFGTGYSGQGTFSASGLGRLAMQDPLTFINAGWDFTSVWGKSTSGANNGYMMLRSLSSGLYDDYVKIGSASRTYGESNSTITGATLSGVGAGNVTFNWGSAIKATTNAGTYNYADAGVISLSETGSRTAYVDYSQNLTIGRRPLTVTAEAQTKTYGDADPTLTYTTTSTVNNDTLSGSLATTTGQYSDVGRYAITQGSLDNANYAINYVGADLTINQRALTVAANAGQSFTYGDTPSLAYSVTSGSLLNGDALSGSLGGLTSTSGVGTYTLTRGTLDNTNYAITFVGNTATVAPRPITVTADAQSKTYGDINPALTYTTNGLVNGDTLSGLLSTAAGQYSNVGGYAITQGALAASNNYVLTYIGANLAVTQRPLTVTANALSKTYGDINPALTYTTNGLVNGDTVSGSLATLAAQYSNVGSYAITQGSLTASGNYALTYIGADLTVNRRALTVAADALSRTYGDANPTLTYTVGGAGPVNGDTLSGSLSTSAMQYSNVGTYGITIGSLGNSNYSISFTGADLTINPRLLTVTADALSKAYGDVNPMLTYTVGGAGLVNGDTLSGSLVTTAGQYSNVGTYTISQGTLGNSNYSVSYAGADLTINKRALTVTADALSKAFGDANQTLTYTVGGAGLVNGDTLSGSLVTTAGQYSNVGTYGITIGSLGNTNYSVSYTGADLTINKRALTVTADALSKAYGDTNPALTYTVGGAGLVNGDTLSGLLSTAAGQYSNVGPYTISQGTLGNSNYSVSYTGADLTINKRALTVTADALSKAYGDTNPTLTYTVGGAGLVNGDTLFGSLVTTAGQYSNVGTYAILQGSLGNANYAITYSGADLTINKRAITVAADNQSRIYGNANPALTYAIGGAGLVNSDTLSGLLATSATGSSNVGTYDITQGTLTASGNYDLSFIGGDLTVSKRAITVTGNSQSRIYGDANPALTYVIGGAGLVNGDGLSGGLATATGPASGVGTYGITQGSLAASGNYDLTFLSGMLSVTPRAIAVTANDATRTYGDQNPVFGYAAVGLVNGDTLTGALAASASQFSGIGSYAIGLGTLGNANYAIAYTGANLTITPRLISVIANNARRAAGAANPYFTYTVAGGGLVNGDRLFGQLASAADRFSIPGSYAIEQGSLAGSANYSLSFVKGILTVTAPPSSPSTDLASAIVPRSYAPDTAPPLPPLPAEDHRGFSYTEAGRGLFLTDPRFAGTVVCLGDGTGCLVQAVP